jgi:predicted membrane chloride channel (bestrophin family)
MHTGQSYRLFEFLDWTRRDIYALIVLGVVPAVAYQTGNLKWLATSLGRVGESTESPFEGSANDIPISQMCRTAEMDLRAMLGETDLPSPLQPTNNIVL